MGTEYKISSPDGIEQYLHLSELCKLKSYWKFDPQYRIYYFGEIDNSGWPAVMVWRKDGAIGITVNDESSFAWIELRNALKDLAGVHEDISISDWDSGDDASEHVLGSL